MIDLPRGTGTSRYFCKDGECGVLLCREMGRTAPRLTLHN